MKVNSQPDPTWFGHLVLAGLMTFFPFVYNHLFHMGFYTFSLSLAMVLFVIGYWIKYNDNLKVKQIVWLCFLTLILYLCHIVSFVVVCMIIAILFNGIIASEIVQQWRYHRISFGEVWHYLLKRASKTVYAFLPAVILAAIFVLSRNSVSEPGTDIFQRLKT